MVVSVFMLKFHENFSNFSYYFLIQTCLRCSGKQDNSLFDQVGLILLSKPLVGPPQGFWGSGEKGYLFSGSWGALLIILGELGSKHILLGI